MRLHTFAFALAVAVMAAACQSSEPTNPFELATRTPAPDLSVEPTPDVTVEPSPVGTTFTGTEGEVAAAWAEFLDVYVRAATAPDTPDGWTDDLSAVAVGSGYANALSFPASLRDSGQRAVGTIAADVQSVDVSGPTAVLVDCAQYSLQPAADQSPVTPSRRQFTVTFARTNDRWQVDGFMDDPDAGCATPRQVEDAHAIMRRAEDAFNAVAAARSVSAAPPGLFIGAAQETLQNQAEFFATYGISFAGPTPYVSHVQHVEAFDGDTRYRGLFCTQATGEWLVELDDGRSTQYRHEGHTVAYSFAVESSDDRDPQVYEVDKVAEGDSLEEAGCDAGSS